MHIGEPAPDAVVVKGKPLVVDPEQVQDRRVKVVRMNRDTLYSSAVFDLDASPVTITMPDAGPRFMSMQIWDEDEYYAIWLTPRPEPVVLLPIAPVIACTL